MKFLTLHPGQSRSGAARFCSQPVPFLWSHKLRRTTCAGSRDSPEGKGLHWQTLRAVLTGVSLLNLWHLLTRLPHSGGLVHRRVNLYSMKCDTPW